MTIPVNNKYGNYNSEFPNNFPDLSLLKARQTGATGDQIPPATGGDKSNYTAPSLPAPTTDTIDWNAFVGITSASFGANALAIIQQTMNESRQQAQESRYNEHMSIATKMEAQAEEMRDKATEVFAMQMTSAVISFVASAYSSVASAKALKTADSSTLLTLNTQIQGVSGMISSMGKVMDAGASLSGSLHDAEIKNMDAQIERMRANIETLNSLVDSLKEVLKGAREAQNALQSDINQTKRKILTA